MSPPEVPSNVFVQGTQTRRRLTLGGLIGEGGLEMVTTGEEGDLLRVESDEGLLDGLDVGSFLAIACIVQLLQLMLLLLDVSSGGGNIFIQRDELLFQ